MEDDPILLFSLFPLFLAVKRRGEVLSAAAFLSPEDSTVEDAALSSPLFSSLQQIEEERSRKFSFLLVSVIGV